MKKRIVLGVMVALMAGCAAPPSQNVYRYDEVGKSVAVSFGTVVAVRGIDITGKNTGTGAVVGATGGAIAGAGIAHGNNSSLAAGVAGAVVGAVVGAAVEQAAANRKGLEYTVVLESGVPMTIAQDVGENDVVLKPGDRVIVQNSGGYQRVLPADHLPTEIERPKGIKLIDPPGRR